MIKRASECKVELREKMRGGEGTVRIEHFWVPEKEIGAKNRLMAKLVLEPGAGIGFHTHDNEEEVILKGQAETDDNGTKQILNPGDSSLTGNGAGHSIRNIGTETLEVMAIISCY